MVRLARLPNERHAFGAVRQAFETAGEGSPDWLRVGMLERALERLRALRGQWRATSFGEAMELRISVGG